jgi:tetratricopeptide (TPR) repeat protein
VQRGWAYAHRGEWPKALADYDKATELGPNDANLHNNLAWDLATHADAPGREPGRALQWAKKAVELEPNEGAYWNTLGIASYRAGDWKAALAALEESMELRNGGDSSDWFFLAMCNEKLGGKEKARAWYDKAVAWMAKNEPHNDVSRRFRAETEDLLGLKEKKKEPQTGVKSRGSLDRYGSAPGFSHCVLDEPRGPPMRLS